MEVSYLAVFESVPCIDCLRKQVRELSQYPDGPLEALSLRDFKVDFLSFAYLTSSERRNLC
jgi:hypothetical protein